jgi:hypothetical protein
LFNGRETDVQNEAKSGQPLVITEVLKHGDDSHVCENRHFTLGIEVFPYALQSVLYDIVTLHLSYRSASTEDVKETATGSLNRLAAKFHDEGIVELVQHLDRCLIRDGAYVEKQAYAVSSSDINIIWMNKVLFITKRFLL